jgi:hypothetical protein
MAAGANDGRFSIFAVGACFWLLVDLKREQPPWSECLQTDKKIYNALRIFFLNREFV